MCPLLRGLGTARLKILDTGQIGCALFRPGEAGH
jgi:hypothetical protein